MHMTSNGADFNSDYLPTMKSKSFYEYACEDLHKCKGHECASMHEDIVNQPLKVVVSFLIKKFIEFKEIIIIVFLRTTYL